MSATWWVRRGEVPDGPFTVDQLKQLASNGKLDRMAEIRLGKTTKWVEAQQMGWLSECFEPTSPEMTDQIPPELPSRPAAPPASRPAAPTDLSSGFAYPWYLYAIIGAGINIMLALVVLIIFVYRADDVDSSVDAVAANDRGGNNTHEENIDDTSEPEVADHVDPEPHQEVASPGEKSNSTTTNEGGSKPSIKSRTRAAGSEVAAPARLADRLIANGTDEKLISQAVGLVVCGWKGVSEHGSHFESRRTALVYEKREVKSLDARQQERLWISDDGDGWEFLLGHSGSCFMVSPDGYMLTNKHVIEDLYSMLSDSSLLGRIKKQFAYQRLQPTVWVILEGTAREAEIVQVSADFDLAILKIDVDRSPCFKLAAADQLPRLTSVLSLGFPAAARQGLNDEEDFLEWKNSFHQKEEIESLFKPSDFEYVVTRGNVNVMQYRELSGRLIQHNADISAGSSGGPLIDENGLVWGINTYSITQSSGGIASGIFHALMVQQLRSEIDHHVRRCKWE